MTDKSEKKHTDLQQVGRKLFSRSRDQARTLESAVRSFQIIGDKIEVQKELADTYAKASSAAKKKNEDSKVRIAGLSEIFDSMTLFQGNLSNIGLLINKIKDQLAMTANKTHETPHIHTAEGRLLALGYPKYNCLIRWLSDLRKTS